jgi:serine/threonine protein kinase
MTAAHVDRQTFLANLDRSGLVEAQRLAAALKELPATDRARLLARALVERGLLTKFQAEMLLGGRTHGFVLGQYRILDQVGRGGMGRVFKAVHQTMNRVVALKVVSSSLVKTDKAQQMFQREVRAAARLLHPHIVTAYDANAVGDRHYLVMEFVDGPNLEQLVGERGPLPVGLACDFVRQTADGLQYASEMGMVHRDVKPSNLLVKEPERDAPLKRGVVKILDFGLARLHAPGLDVPPGQGTLFAKQNTVIGTPDYLSPEQARDLHQADIRSDLYSLGCTFYYVLTGKVPFPGGTTLEKLVRHATEEPVPVEQLRPDVPPAVAAVVRRLMAKDPSGRFQTPAELAAALAPFAVAGPTGWANSGAGQPSAEPVVTPPADSGGGLEARVLTESDQASATPPVSTGSGFDFGALPAGADDESILLGALAQGQSATGLSGKGPASLRLRQEVAQEQRRKVKIAVCCAAGAVLLLLLIGFLLLR